MRLAIAILAGLAMAALAEDMYRIIEVSKNATDWSATVSINGGQAQAITFPLGKRPTDVAIIAKATAQETARKAAAAAVAAAQAVDPTEHWTVTRIIAGRLVTNRWAIGTRPTAEDMQRVIQATAAQGVKP